MFLLPQRNSDRAAALPSRTMHKVHQIIRYGHGRLLGFYEALSSARSGNHMAYATIDIFETQACWCPGLDSRRVGHRVTAKQSYWLMMFSGGVRGIIELEVLKAIETELGGKIPIQAFFDLIVGTRYYTK